MAGIDVPQAIFNQIDVNRDGVIDPTEFHQWANGANATRGASGRSFAGYDGSSNYEASSSYSGGPFAGDAGYYTAGASLGGTGYSGYDSSVSYLNGYDGGVGYNTSALYGGSHDGGYGSHTTSGWATDAQGLYQDSNPQIIRRPAPGGGVTYKQNILVRFLQPPPVPPPGPLIIKEVRPPQPPAPPPLRIRQRAPPLRSLPPLVLRERPPLPPLPIQSQLVIRRLAALPVPPRSVIIERLPPLPPKPRDVIIERWLPYGRRARRRVILQRAGPARLYPRPRNIVIQYEPIQAQVVRQFQRLGVQAENPHHYVQRYGSSLRDSFSLLQEARHAGVVEDISPPGVVGTGYAGTNTYYGGLAQTYADAYGIPSVYDWGTAGDGYYAGLHSSQSRYDSGYTEGYDGGQYLSSSLYESGLYGGGNGVSSANGFDVVNASSHAADTNQEGPIDQEEYYRLAQRGLL
ncbi:unnamed protein product [Didymodactylos carnosus]|uniref:EF-hand domain-containing protein n=1 Tax=Didymodactylos carnosus TaxID=1234261 RepID=A0A815G9C9_9BILA|nr:unnamed protein product [Didymodactylos carnosus]CAF4193891.1 unnamed protein product [Didymodactylos carnosus]